MTLKVAVIENYKRFVNDLKKHVNVPVDFVIIEDAKNPESFRLIEDADMIFGSRVTEPLLKHAKKAKVVQVIGAGIRLELLEVVRKFPNILLANSHGNAIAVAEHAIALMMAVAKHIPQYDKRFRQGKWSLETDTYSIQLHGKVLGVLGLGHIGREIAKMGKCLGMKVYAIKRHPSEQIKRELNLDYLGSTDDLFTVLRAADFVVVALPKTPETHNLIDEKELRALKKTAYLINISRGDIINEEALFKALKERWFSGAGLDVWYVYPKKTSKEEDQRTYPSKYPFHELDNVIMTPHIAWKTPESMDNMLLEIAKNIERLYKGQELINIVNKDLGY